MRIIFLLIYDGARFVDSNAVRQRKSRLGCCQELYAQALMRLQKTRKSAAVDFFFFLIFSFSCLTEGNTT